MIKKPVFYSFHYKNDVFRVQQIRNIGVLEGNPPANPNDWESIKRKGDAAIQKWIDDNMKYRQCVIVLVGSETANRKWVKYEIKKAWEEGKPIFGIYIHNLKNIDGKTSYKGRNPFDLFTTSNGVRLSSLVPCYDPGPFNAYQDIASNIANWIDIAIAQRR